MAGGESTRLEKNSANCRCVTIQTSLDPVSEILAAEESTTPPGTPPHPSAASLPLTTPKRVAHAADTTTSPSKRRYVPDQQDVEVVKRIKQNEVELHDRNTVLRGTKPNVRLNLIMNTSLCHQPRPRISLPYKLPMPKN